MPSWLRTRFDDTAAGGDHATRERRASMHPPSMHPASCGGSRGIRPSVPPPTAAHRRRAPATTVDEVSLPPVPWTLRYRRRRHRCHARGVAAFVMDEEWGK